MNERVTIHLPAQHRGAQLRATSFNPEDNTIEVVWTTGAKVRRVSWLDGVYDEVLEVTTEAVRLDRLNAGASFLNSHSAYDLGDVIGSVVPGSARIARGQGIARVLLSDAPSDSDLIAKIRSGVIKNISVGYRVHEVVKAERDGDVPLHTVTNWEPLEISAVPIPADPGAQVRAEGQRTYPAIIINRTAQEGGMPKTPINSPADQATMEAERSRASMITDIGSRFAPELVGPAIAGGQTIDEFRAAVINHLANRDERGFEPGGRHQFNPSAYAAAAGPSAHEERRAAAMQSAILHRVDPATFKPEAGAEVFMAMPLLEIARASVEGSGVRTAGMSKMAIAGAALSQRSGGMLSTTDFPSVLTNATNKILRATYESAAQTFRPLVRVTTVADFKEVSRAQVSEAPMLERVGEHGEFKRGAIGDAAEKFKLETFGKIIAITRQAIVNDDLSAFDRIPRAFGVQAASLEADLCWSQILQNAPMGDNVALFHSTHKNLLTAGAIGETTVGEARLKMGLQTGLDKKTVLNLTPEFIIVPKALEVAALKFVTSITPAKTDDAIPREIRNLTVIAEPRLDLGIARYGIPGSPTNYYFATSPTFVDVIELAYLEGQEGIYTETRQGFEVDGLEIKARLDVAAKVIDWRGLSKNPYAG